MLPRTHETFERYVQQPNRLWVIKCLKRFRPFWNQDELEDMVNLVWANAWRQWPRYDERYAITTWLGIIVRNTWGRKWQDAKRKRRSFCDAIPSITELLDDELSEDAFDPEDPAADTPRLVLDRLCGERLRRMIDDLPERQRHILMARLADRTYQSIADELDLTNARVWKIEQAAIRALRRHREVPT